jgi:hypothetical protein
MVKGKNVPGIYDEDGKIIARVAIEAEVEASKIFSAIRIFEMSIQLITKLNFA